ncbi:aminopeptidase P family protein [Fusobacterium hominis]|uniref:Aminopeptidase P family protein n=1 Tax=Fusobacterium hominis TaxID=2764326 RepID=A0A7G9GUR8_9FUSO|nr:aminopeptidase P family protein [Fusobacterium hominis]QNM14550.1 aminopeptidase P family protein [Fusobacterium hominis]
MKIADRVLKLRELMREKGIDVYIVPSVDFHQSEYVGEYFKCREWISGFTGSAGTVVVTHEMAGLWTDGRYFIQAAKQLEGTGIQLFKMGEPGVPSFIEFIVENIKKGQCVGFDGKVMSVSQVNDLKSKFQEDIKINSDYDLIDMLWTDRPDMASSKAFVLDTKYCGEDIQSKLSRIREALEKENCDINIISSLDDIAWIFNLRGNDVKNNPVNLAYAIITADKAILYIDDRKLDNSVEEYLYENHVDVREYFEIYEDAELISSSEVVMMDFNKTNFTIYNRIKDVVKIINRPNPSNLMKACKNEVELENLRKCHLRDGVAVTKFMHWLKNQVSQEKITEMSASEILEGFRKDQDLYIEPSFDTISAYGANAAMMHYKATKDSDATLKPYGLLLVDSGGQYYDGTTDITRTFVLGECSYEIKKHFTLVLKGMIKLSKAKFLYGATGTNLDILARQSLWEQGIDYKCGTGHGVGFLLNVHEGPQGIRFQYNSQRLEEGMNVTNEPGVYIEGSHGIRLENELIVQKDLKTEFGQFMKFETMTYVPLDLDGIIPELLSEDEKEFLNNYHRMVREKLSPYFDESEIDWLKEYTREI